MTMPIAGLPGHPIDGQRRSEGGAASCAPTRDELVGCDLVAQLAVLEWAWRGERATYLNRAA
jgi:hypothetical protein